MIHWSKQGNTFIIENIERFERELLPLYFRHNRYQSFVRQLNMYDFHKIRNGDYYCDNKSEFGHEEFYQGNVEAIHHIKRKGFQFKSREEEKTRSKKIAKNLRKKREYPKNSKTERPTRKKEVPQPKAEEEEEEEENSFFADFPMESPKDLERETKSRDNKIQKIVDTVLEHYKTK
jgi:seryl-tRNA synthetase